MCGIYGVLATGAAQRPDPSVLRRMGDSILHRGPDDEGSYVDELLLLGMRRLSIIDVTGGHQPIASEDGSVIVVCYGEIYNFSALREQLQKAGHRFATNSDTEVIVHLYEEHGSAFVEQLEGMFAFALWDRRQQRLTLARDELGIKPLYFTSASGCFAFASEAKALLTLPSVRTRLDPAALAQYLSVGYVPPPATLFDGIRKLMPGEALAISGKEIKTRRFVSTSPEVDSTLSQSEWIDATRHEIERAVRDQMVSDVPIGAFLSGGVDSSAVVAFMTRHSDVPVKTYSIGFRGSTGAELYNELPYARQVANAFKTNHREIIVQPNVAELLPGCFGTSTNPSRMPHSLQHIWSRLLHGKT